MSSSKLKLTSPPSADELHNAAKSVVNDLFLQATKHLGESVLLNALGFVMVGPGNYLGWQLILIFGYALHCIGTLSLVIGGYEAIQWIFWNCFVINGKLSKLFQSDKFIRAIALDIYSNDLVAETKAKLTGGKSPAGDLTASEENG